MESLSRIPEHAGVRGKTFSGFPELIKAVGLDADKKPVCSEKIESSGEPYAIEVIDRETDA